MRAGSHTDIGEQLGSEAIMTYIKMKLCHEE